MTNTRIFVSYYADNASHSGTEIVTQLIADLQHAGAEVVTDSDSTPEEALLQFLNRELSQCQWLVLVQTPQALSSVRVQTAVNIALNQVTRQKMKGVLRVLATSPDEGDTQEIPYNWTTTREFDASQDYPRARDRMLLAMGLINLDTLSVTSPHVMLPGQSSQPFLAAPGSDRPAPLDVPTWLDKPDRRVMPLRLSRRTVIIGLAGVVVAGGIGGGIAWLTKPKPQPGEWVHTGQLLLGRTRFRAITLPSGMVLIEGGFDPGTYTDESELFDPKTGSWTHTGRLTEARSEHFASLQPDGKVLVVAGYAGKEGFKNSAELYDPTTHTWSLAGRLKQARSQHTGVQLPHGSVLIAGGRADNDNPLNTAEIYNYATESWSSAGNLIIARVGAVGVLLQNGKVLVAGGYNPATNVYLAEAELYDPDVPASNAWTATGSMSVPRTTPAAVLLPNGKVLVAGGVTSKGLTETAELYDPATGSWSLTSSMRYARGAAQAVPLMNNTILVVGGDLQGASEIYDLSNGTWTSPVSVGQTRCDAATTLLHDGRVLIAGGSDCPVDGKRLVTAAIYTSL